MGIKKELLLRGWAVCPQGNWPASCVAGALQLPRTYFLVPSPRKRRQRLLQGGVDKCMSQLLRPRRGQSSNTVSRRGPGTSSLKARLAKASSASNCRRSAGVSLSIQWGSLPLAASCFGDQSAYSSGFDSAGFFLFLLLLYTIAQLLDVKLTYDNISCGNFTTAVRHLGPP